MIGYFCLFLHLIILIVLVNADHYEIIRMRPSFGLKESLLLFSTTKNITAGTVVMGIGSLAHLRLRLAGATHNSQNVVDVVDNFEIISLAGTLGGGKCHIHMSVSSTNGTVLGGHLLDGNIISTTAEVSIVVHDNKLFLREFDLETHFEELVII